MCNNIRARLYLPLSLCCGVFFFDSNLILIQYRFQTCDRDRTEQQRADILHTIVKNKFHTLNFPPIVFMRAKKFGKTVTYSVSEQRQTCRATTSNSNSQLILSYRFFFCISSFTTKLTRSQKIKRRISTQKKLPI